MFSGVLALLERSLRVDARAWAPHLARFGLMAGIYFAATYASATSSMFGAPGLRFFRSIAYLDLVFMTLMGIGFFSTAITEEKEENTLGLMLMAGISPLGLLLGKSVGRLFQALLLIAVQYPFTLLAVTLGGVTQDQVRSVYLAIFAYLILLSGIGLLCSTLASRSRTSALVMTLFLLLYVALPSVSTTWLSFNIWTGTSIPKVLVWIAESCVYLQIRTILDTGSQQPIVTHQVVTNVAIGGLGFALSWLLFAVAGREPSSEAISRGLTVRSPDSIFSAGRPKGNPFAWKDFYFSSGGVAAAQIRIAYYVALYIASTAVTEGWVFGPWWSTGYKATLELFLILTMASIAIDAGLLVSRSLHDEIRGQTLAALLMLPTTTGKILYAKVGGALRPWLTGPAFLLIGIVTTSNGRESTIRFFQTTGAPLWLILHLILVPHLAAVAAMYLRWGALPLGIAAAIGSGFVTGSIFTAIRAHDDDPIIFFVDIGLVVICLSCHVVVWLRAEALSAK